MADLDDFFAKRDKKKPKGKKFATAEDAANDATKVLRNKVQKDTGKSNYVMPLTESGEVQAPINEYRQPENEDDEWKEVVEVQPDFTNLKIQELILEDEDDFGGKELEGREDADSDFKEGPWNKVKDKSKVKDESKLETQQPSDILSTDSTSVTTTTSETVTTVTPNDEENEEESRDKVPSEEPKKTVGYVPPNKRKEGEAGAQVCSEAAKAYVPPSRRGGQATASSTSTTATRSKKPMTVPSMESEENFPSLGS